MSSPSMTLMTTMPPVRPEAVSMESARRERMSGFTTSRSTTISMVCLRFFSSWIFSLRS